MISSTHFYTQLVGAEPVIGRADCKKWMLDRPFVNIAIEPAIGETDIAHVGLQAKNAEKLAQVYSRTEVADGPEFCKGEAQCCYAHSHKSWTRDPDGSSDLGART